MKLFFMIKPDGMLLEAKIREMIEPLARVVATRFFEPVDIEKIERLYDMLQKVKLREVYNVSILPRARVVQTSL